VHLWAEKNSLRREDFGNNWVISPKWKSEGMTADAIDRPNDDKLQTGMHEMGWNWRRLNLNKIVK